jgi:curved DNA-binding protein CbpA
VRLHRNYYEILGVPRTASPQEITDKYRELARKYHPDRASDKDLAQRIFSQVNRSYTTLSNPEKRAVYDLRLIGSAEPPPSSAFSFSAGTAPDGGRPAMRPNTQTAQPEMAAGSGSTSSDPTASSEASSLRAPSPDQIRQWLSEAVSSQQQGNIEAAMSLCRRVLSADPRNFPGLMLLGDLLARQGRHGDALAQYQCAVAIQPAHRDIGDKIARVKEVLARKAQAASASGEATAAKTSPAPERPAAKKSLIDRLIHRGK